MQCIDVFSGMGGASLGLLIAGFEHILAAEMNPFAVLSYMANFPGVPVCTRNLFLYSFEEICVAYRIGRDFAGLIWLSCPCQGVSSGGNKAGDADLRNNLLFKVIQAARYAPHAWICLENVPGLKKGNAEPIYDRLMSQLRETRQVVEFSIHSDEWGWPQERERVFIIAAPEGWKGAMPSEPKPSADVKHKFVDDAILKNFNDLDPDFFELTDSELPIYAEIPDGGNWKDGANGRRYAEILGIKPEAKKKTFLRRINSKGKCYCLMASPPMGSDYRCDFVHPSALRHISVGEAKKLMNLPDGWLLAGPIEDRWRQTGNGVMPIMSELIGKAIMAAAKEPDGKMDSNGSADRAVAPAGTTPSGLVPSACRDDRIVTVENGFSRLFDREHQIAMIQSAIDAAEESRFAHRFHCLLYGPPACGKSDILKAFAKALGQDRVLTLDATMTTQAGAADLACEVEKLPPYLFIEEIEKAHEHSLRWLLGVLDQRAEIRTLNFNKGIAATEAKVLCIATANDIGKFDKLLAGALSSRFPHKIQCPRPDTRILNQILLREIRNVGGKPEWAAPALDHCLSMEKTDDPRRVISVCLSGRDKLLTGEYQKSLTATSRGPAMQKNRKG